MGTYLYGIVASNRQFDLGHIGLPDGRTLVTTLQDSGLIAVVSEYLGPAFTELPKAEILSSLVTHQRVIERTMSRHTALPVKFGTVLDSTAETHQLLHGWCSQLADALADLAGTVEIEVVVTWDPKRAFAEIGAIPEIAALAASVRAGQPEDALSIRIEIGRLAKQAFDQHREQLRRSILGALAPRARDVQPNLVPADEVVGNLAFLVDRDSLDAFYREVQRLDESLGGHLNFRCVGPMAPYSFATVEAVRLGSGQMAAACQLLGLEKVASESELNARYRSRAAEIHPDRNPDDPAATTRFSELAQAHALLLNHVRGQSPSASALAVADRILAGDRDGPVGRGIPRDDGSKSLHLTIRRSNREPAQRVGV